MIKIILYYLGKDVLNNYYYNEYLKSRLNKDKTYHLSSWKTENKVLVDKFEDTTFIINLGLVLVGWVLTCNLLEKKTVTKIKS